MKKYFIGYKEITREQADEITAKNFELLNSGDIGKLIDCEFITVINQ